MRKKLDPRIRKLIENSVKNNHRCLILLTGQRANDQVVIIHYLLSKATLKCRPTVLWCYKKELGFSTHRKKRMRRIQKNIQTYKCTASANDDPFELFVVSTEIRWCYYSESHKILGQTFGMLVLQDFEALTPNLLARTVETVQGGGVVVIVVPELNDLLKSDMHEHLISADQKEAMPRFNRRFLLSIRSCKQSALVINDKLDVLWASNKTIEPINYSLDSATTIDYENLPKEDRVGKLCKTQDQLNSYLAILNHFKASSLPGKNKYLALSASRGRGKSACMGLAISTMIGKCVEHCIVTAPALGNVSEFFRFCVEGLKTQSLEVIKDFDVIKIKRDDDSGEMINAIHLKVDGKTRVIEYKEAEELIARDDLTGTIVVVDEAAALAIPIVNRLSRICSRLMFASTLDGYEGTGRALALQFYKNVRSQTKLGHLIEVELHQPIRYGERDPVEHWLYKLLCLRCKPAKLDTIPTPEECELFAVDRDVLFSNGKPCEEILAQINSILTSAHYRNTPNDLQMLSDAPAHALFVLVYRKGQTPVILSVVQVVFEGKFDAESVQKAAGDMIPWTLCQQYGSGSGFSKLSGLRVVRIATHPDAQSKGFGSATMKLLYEHFNNATVPTSESTIKKALFISTSDRLQYASQGGAVAIPAKVDYLGVSFGLSQDLLRFWTRLGYLPVYLRQTASPLTGQNTCIMIKPTTTSLQDMVVQWYGDFCERTARLTHTEELRRMPASMLMMLLSQSEFDNPVNLQLDETRISRLRRCAEGNAELSICLDILSYLLTEQYPMLHHAIQSPLKRTILIGLAGQGKSVEAMSKELNVDSERILVSACSIVKDLVQQRTE